MALHYHDENPCRKGDGWHKFMQYKIYVEDGLIIRCEKKDSNGHWIPAYTYRNHNCGGRSYHWVRENMSPAALRAGFSRGTCTIA